ncbi:hypothetical protein R5R35_013755 [Gryllus longicercus]|uniref:Uncharacterized protein n=1 Tax=Gryllus longicercus TaxID=2509291 RepID=A0AAN9WAL0_9ORTH
MERGGCSAKCRGRVAADSFAGIDRLFSRRAASDAEGDSTFHTSPPHRASRPIRDPALHTAVELSWMPPLSWKKARSRREGARQWLNTHVKYIYDTAGWFLYF